MTHPVQFMLSFYNGTVPCAMCMLYSVAQYALCTTALHIVQYALDSNEQEVKQSTHFHTQSRRYSAAFVISTALDTVNCVNGKLDDTVESSSSTLYVLY